HLGCGSVTWGSVDDGAKVSLAITTTWHIAVDAWQSAHACYNEDLYTGTEFLDAGAYPLLVEYYQGNSGNACLTVQWDGPGFSEEPIPNVGSVLPAAMCNSATCSCESNPA